jgi:acyl-coenzyme A synthetase/AMP-(fatty) acid ligase/3-hydroxymyristoyl/3-hydroxydecanoyl-(acyl carrier protein) dehydratase
MTALSALLAHRPDDLVAVGDAGARTAGDLARDAGRLAAALAAHPPGDVVLACGDRYLFLAALLGAWGAGHVVRLPANGQPETVRALAEDPGVRALLHDREGAEGVRLEALLAAAPAAGRLVLPDLGRHLVTVTSSGSTGTHQRYAKTGAQLLDEALAVARLFDVEAGARVLSTVPPFHMYGLVFGVLAAVRRGGAVVREGPLHAEALWAALLRHGATDLVSVPPSLAALLGLDEGAPLPALRRLWSAGSPLPAAVGAAAARRGRMIEIYGASETGAVAWRGRVDEPWMPLPGVAVGADAEGQLLVDAPWLGPGEPRPFACADRVELEGGAGGAAAPRPGARFGLLGRADGVVKVGGKRVSLREVEQRLLGLAGVRDAAVLAAPTGSTRGTELWAAVAAAGWTPERVREALAAWLDPVTLPRRIRVVDALPREATGKLVRARLAALFGPPGAEAPATGRLDEIVEPESEEALPGAEGEEVRRLTLTISPRLRWFQGHFPGRPVLPGVAQLDALVLRQAERLWPDLGTLAVVQRLKFKRPVLPGARLALTLRRRAADRTVAFELTEGDEGCASGTLRFREEGLS